jgi:hypothetical protein
MKKKVAPKRTAKKKPLLAILANKSYGLYFGEVLSFDAANGVAAVKDCCHVCRWFGRTGGITSLAAYGICGPRMGESRIGAPTTQPSTLTGIVNIFPCSEEAVRSFDAVKPQ